jgi:4-diphosphocytidyl-2-C-methyl-D-erythritol kinase
LTLSATEAPLKIWLAPAKINLFLHITGRRADGYHELQSIFQFLDYADELTFRIIQQVEIIHSNPLSGVAIEDDLTVRAARLLQQYTRCKLGVEIYISKKLPMGGGLGGGSSDAATTLVALNQLWKLGLGKQALAELGGQLGADVPVFIHGRAAWAEGVGEKLTPVEVDEPWYVVLVPPVSISTAEIFSAKELNRGCVAIKMSDYLAGTAENVCEPVVGSRYPQVKSAIEWLNQYSKARMTGTGACVFAPMSSAQRAADVLREKPEGYSGFIAKGRNVSPLYG